MRPWFALLACCSLAMASSQVTAIDLLVFNDHQGNRVYGDINTSTRPGTILLEVAASCPLDFSDLYVTGAYNDSITLLFPNGATLTYKDHLVLDAQGKASITALASDKVTRQDYIISTLRHAPASTVTPYEFDIVDEAGNWREAYVFSAAYSHGDVDTVAHTISFQLPYDADIDLEKLHIRTRFSSSFDNNYGYGYLGVRTAQGDTVDPKHPLVFDAEGKTRLTLLSEDGLHSEAYTLTVRRDTASAVTALGNFEVSNRKGQSAGTRQIRSLHNPSTLVITLPYSSPLRLDSLYGSAEAIDYSKITLWDTLGNPLAADKPLPFDSKGLLPFQVMAEDSSTQRYWLAVVRSDSLPPPYALKSLTLKEGDSYLNCEVQDKGKDSVHVYCSANYSDTIDLKALSLYNAYGNDNYEANLSDAQGQALASLLNLDDQGRLLLTLRHPDGTRRPVALHVERLPKSKQTRLSHFCIWDAQYTSLCVDTLASSFGRLDPSQGKIEMQVYQSHPIDLQTLKFYYLKTEQNKPITLLNTQGDTLKRGSALTLDANGSATMRVIAEDGTTGQDYTLHVSRSPVKSASTALGSLSLTNRLQQKLSATARIDTVDGLVEMETGSAFSLLDLSINSAYLGNGYKPTILAENGDTLQSTLAWQNSTRKLQPIGDDTSFYFIVYAEDGKTLQKYRLALKLPPFPLAIPSSSSSGSSSSGTANSSSSGNTSSSSSTGSSSSSDAGNSSSSGTEALSPVSPSLVLDWREALGANGSEASLYSLNGRLLHGAPLSLEALEDRRRSYPGPLLLRIGEALYRLPPLPR